jgi:lipopolysaccharide biosynthesis protein
MGYHVHKNDYSTDVKNLCLMASFLHTGKVPAYIIHHISELKKCGYQTIIVCSSEINEAGINELKKVCLGVVVRENFGYDFFSWKKGLELCEDGVYLENLLLTNDSILGPFSGMKDIFEQMKGFDFWGLTENYEHNYHLQSYFLHANKKIIQTKSWNSFWEGLQLYENKLDFVKNYEVELSQTLLQEKELKIGTWLSNETIKKKSEGPFRPNHPKTDFWNGISNPTVRHWQKLLELGFPFLKKNLFFEKEHYHVVMNSKLYVYKVYPINWKNILTKRFSDSAVKLIEDYLTDYYEEKTPYKNVVTESYKILFVYEEIADISVGDYLLRFLRFYNSRNIPTELILNTSEDSIHKSLRYQLNDITRVVYLKDIGSVQKEEHKYQLSNDKIGSIIIGDLESIGLASSYFYTGSPLMLIADRNDDVNLFDRYSNAADEIGATLITPLPSVRNKIAKRGSSIKAIDFIGTQCISKSEQSINFKNNFKVGIAGLDNIEGQHEQIAYLLESIIDNPDIGQCILFLHEEESQSLNAFARKASVPLNAFKGHSKFSIVQYGENFEDTLDDIGPSVIVSYSETKFLPQYLIDSCKKGIPVLGVYNKGIQSELFGVGNKNRFEYFNIGKLADFLDALSKNIVPYFRILGESGKSFENYKNSFDTCEIEKFLLKEVVDLSESKKLIPKITVIFHFHFYSFDKVTFTYYKKRLREFYRNNVDYLFSITEDSYDIKGGAKSLKDAFVNSTIKIVPNKGRDIGAKFLLFDYYFRTGAKSEYLVVLHDKKSLHLPYWEARAWIESLLKIIEASNYNTIIGKFEENKDVGVIGTQERIVDCILRWESLGVDQRPVFEWNNDLLHDLIQKYSIRITNYNFVGGTMFWIKSDVLQMVHEKYDFLKKFEELEEGNVLDNNGSTITHCWERLLCWISADLGYKVSGI